MQSVQLVNKVISTTDGVKRGISRFRLTLIAASAFDSFGRTRLSALRRLVLRRPVCY